MTIHHSQCIAICVGWAMYGCASENTIKTSNCLYLPRYVRQYCDRWARPDNTQTNRNVFKTEFDVHFFHNISRHFGFTARGCSFAINKIRTKWKRNFCDRSSWQSTPLLSTEHMRNEWIFRAVVRTENSELMALFMCANFARVIEINCK